MFLYQYPTLDPSVFVNRIQFVNMTKAANDAFINNTFNITLKKDKLNINCTDKDAVNYTVSEKIASRNVSNVGPIGATNAIQGCLLLLETFPAKCGQCNSYSNLSSEGNSCNCQFRYNITTENNDTVVIKHFLNVSSSLVAPNSPPVNCSQVLNYTFSNASVEEEYRNELDNL